MQRNQRWLLGFKLFLVSLCFHCQHRPYVLILLLSLEEGKKKKRPLVVFRQIVVEKPPGPLERT